MEVLYPPVDEKTLGLLKISLFRVPKRHREDAAQEMWLAFLEQDRNPLASDEQRDHAAINAISDYASREALHEGREIAYRLADSPADKDVWAALSLTEKYVIEKDLSQA